MVLVQIFVVGQGVGELQEVIMRGLNRQLVLSYLVVEQKGKGWVVG